MRGGHFAAFNGLVLSTLLTGCGPSLYTGNFNGTLTQNVTCDNGGTAAAKLPVSFGVTENQGLLVVAFRNQCTWFASEGPKGATLNNPDAKPPCGADTTIEAATLAAPDSKTLQVTMTLKTSQPTKCTSILTGSLGRE